jgi:XisH protein
MPRKDIFHEVVKSALLFDGWAITDDPLFVPTKGRFNFFIDIGAERIINAQKDEQKVAIEVKSFNDNSPLYSFYEILGQFLVYELALEESDNNWSLFIAISEIGYSKLYESPIFQRAMEKYNLKFIIIDASNKKIVEWKK